MNDIVPFQFCEQPVRVLDRNGEPWWIASDVTAILEFRMASDATRSLDEDEKGYADVRTPGGMQNVVIVNESGVYTLIFRSKAEKARDFRRWVTHEVLPAIRRTGRYEHPGSDGRIPYPEQIDTLRAAARMGLIPRAEARRRGLHILASIGLADEPPTPEQERLDHAVRWLRREYTAGETFSARSRTPRHAAPQAATQERAPAVPAVRSPRPAPAGTGNRRAPQPSRR
jgi:prophage antirepressor-like protein